MAIGEPGLFTLVKVKDLSPPTASPVGFGLPALALLPLLCRVAGQFVSYKPREVDSKLSLRVWFLLLCASNLPSFWSHTRGSPTEGRAIVLDFVGVGYPPTKLHLLLLDAFILLLQIILTTISYEKSLHLSSPSTVPDALLPAPASPVAFPSSGSSMENETAKRSHHESPWILDLRLRHIINRLHEPAPPTPETHATLPLPNTTPLPIPFHLRAIMRRRVHREDVMVDTENPGRGLPGGMGVDDI